MVPCKTENRLIFQFECYTCIIQAAAQTLRALTKSACVSFLVGRILVKPPPVIPVTRVSFGERRVGRFDTLGKLVSAHRVVAANRGWRASPPGVCPSLAMVYHPLPREGHTPGGGGRLPPIGGRHSRTLHGGGGLRTRCAETKDPRVSNLPTLLSYYMIL